MKKEIVQNWMRFAWRSGDEKEIANIPAEAVEILKAEEPKDSKPEKKLSKKPIED
jgi:hypothetical protein